MHKISVEGIKAYGYHGCMEEEALIGQPYVIDVLMDVDFQEAAEEDDLHKTVDYVLINRIAVEEVSKRSKLIESVAWRIANRIKEDLRVLAVEVRVCKPAPPINGNVDRVCTTVTL
jgi:7,8-dihydroneopterin aldolase/epimerase/oxygenase